MKLKRFSELNEEQIKFNPHVRYTTKSVANHNAGGPLVIEVVDLSDTDIKDLGIKGNDDKIISIGESGKKGKMLYFNEEDFAQFKRMINRVKFF